MNAESQLFNPVDLDLSRSSFGMHPTETTTLNAGRLIPTRVLFVQPGDSMKMALDDLMKMSTPVYPTMDQLFEDVYFFYVPFRAVLSRRYGSPAVDDAIYSWAAFVGAQDNAINMPLPANGLTLPILDFDLSEGASVEASTLMDYFPVHVAEGNDVTALPLMAYFAIWNENFRDPNTMPVITWSIDSGKRLVPYGKIPLYATKSELIQAGRATDSFSSDYALVNALGDGTVLNDDAVSTVNYWLPLPVCRFHGYFGSLLPWPQRNTEGVELPLGTTAPVVPMGDASKVNLGDTLIFSKKSGFVNGAGNLISMQSTSGEGGPVTGFVGASTANSVSAISSDYDIKGTNLYADLSTATAANVNALRFAIQKQRWYEKLARSGNRYDELEYGLFGVRPHDSGDDRPQYLGGKRIALKIEMVASTNGGNDTSSAVGSGSLGTLGAFSHTNDNGDYFYHSFDDWGVVFALKCVRHHDTFSSGTDRNWKKLSRDDLYFPTFAHLGEQVTEDYELVNKVPDGTVLGYNPAWQEYRRELDHVSGFLKPGRSLGFMTYARDYANGTTLGEFLNASSQVATVDQTLAVGSNAAGFQFISQQTFHISWRRCMPVDSIPGLMDHF